MACSYRLIVASKWPDGTAKAAGHWLRGLELKEPPKQAE